MEKETKTRFVAFSTQKGGVGKSTFTTLVASLLHYRLGYNVAVFDCDFPQHSLVQMRERDLKAVMQDQGLKKIAQRLFTSIGKKAYPVIECTADIFWEQAAGYLAGSDTPVDVALVDLPGTVNSAGVLTLLAGVDPYLCPDNRRQDRAGEHIELHRRAAERTVQAGAFQDQDDQPVLEPGGRAREIGPLCLL